MPLGMACCKLFTAALAAVIAGDDSSHDKGPVGLGRSRSAVLEYLKIDILTVERERELETAVSTRVLAHVIIREQRAKIQWEKIFDEKVFAIDVHLQNWRKFSLSEIFIVYDM